MAFWQEISLLLLILDRLLIVGFGTAWSTVRKLVTWDNIALASASVDVILKTVFTTTVYITGIGLHVSWVKLDPVSYSLYRLYIISLISCSHCHWSWEFLSLTLRAARLRFLFRNSLKWLHYLDRRTVSWPAGNLLQLIKTPHQLLKKELLQPSSNSPSTVRFRAHS